MTRRRYRVLPTAGPEGGVVLYPNEPTGMTVVAYAPFDVLPPVYPTPAATPTGWVGLWGNFESGSGDTSIIDDALALNGKALRVNYPNGLLGGYAPDVNMNVDWTSEFGEMDELYISYRFRYYGNGTNFEWNGVGIKTFFAAGPTPVGASSNQIYPIIWGEATQPVNTLVTSRPMTGHATILQGVFLADQVTTSDDGSPRIFIGAGWQHMEYYWKQNTLGSADGIGKQWIDGVLVANQTDVVWRRTPATAFHTGTAQAGGASSITLASDASGSNAVYQYCAIRIVSGTGAGQTRTCNGYTGSTKVATVSSAWTTPPDATSAYEIDEPIGLDRKFHSWKLNPTYGGGGNAKTRDDYYDIDQVYISGKAA